MTEQEFFKQAVASGKPKSEIEKVYNNIMADKGFDVDSTTTTTPQPEPQKTNLGQDVMSSLRGTEQAITSKIKRIDKPTVLGTNIRSKVPGYAGQALGEIADVPEKTVRTIGTGLGIAGETAAIPFNIAGAAIDKATGGRASKALQGAISKVADTKVAKDLINWYGELSEAEKANYGTAVDLLEAFSYGAGSAAGKVGKKAVKSTGEGLEQAGKKTLRSAMKVKDPTAKLAGINTEAGVKKIVDDVAKYKLGSKTKGFTGIADKAQNSINDRMSKSAKALSNFTKKDPVAGVNIDDVLDKLADDIKNGRVKQIFTGEDAAADFVNTIKESFDKRGYRGWQTIEKLPKMNQEMREGLDLFKKGKFRMDDAPVKELVGDLVYMRLLEKVGERLPEVRKMGKEINELITVKTAALEAAKRVGNRNDIGLTDVLLLMGGGPALQSMGLAPGLSTIAPLVAGGVVAKKALGSGRGSSGLLSAGRNIKAVSDATKQIPQRVGGYTGLSTLPIIQGKAKNPYEKKK